MEKITKEELIRGIIAGLVGLAVTSGLDFLVIRWPKLNLLWFIFQPQKLGAVRITHLVTFSIIPVFLGGLVAGLVDKKRPWFYCAAVTTYYLVIWVWRFRTMNFVDLITPLFVVVSSYYGGMVGKKLPR